MTRAEDLSRAVPALVATTSGAPNTTFFLRGVGNTTTNSYSDPAISFNYDGVYIGIATGSYFKEVPDESGHDRDCGDDRRAG